MIPILFKTSLSYMLLWAFIFSSVFFIRGMGKLKNAKKLRKHGKEELAEVHKSAAVNNFLTGGIIVATCLAIWLMMPP